MIVVPSSDGTGTNALVRTPPNCIESRFGPGSFRAHLDQALSKGLSAEVLRLPGLMFDIDTPEDVAELLARCARVSRFVLPANRMRLEIAALSSLPEVRPGDDLAALIRQSPPRGTTNDRCRARGGAEDRFQSRRRHRGSARDSAFRARPILGRGME